MVSPFGGPTSSGMLTLHCPPAQLYGLSSFLRQHGADTVLLCCNPVDEDDAALDL